MKYCTNSIFGWVSIILISNLKDKIFKKFVIGRLQSISVKHQHSHFEISLSIPVQGLVNQFYSLQKERHYKWGRVPFLAWHTHFLCYIFTDPCTRTGMLSEISKWECWRLTKILWSLPITNLSQRIHSPSFWKIFVN